MKHSPFFTLDIETLALPGKTNLVAMPSFSFVHVDTSGKLSALYARLPIQEQLDYGSIVSSSTLAFWMSELEKGNPASKEIVKALSSTSAEYFVATYNGLSEDPEAPYSYSGKSTTMFDVFNRVVPEFFKTLSRGPVIGNGPEFDNAIFAAHFDKVAAVSLPWNFWESGSARTIKQISKDANILLDYPLLEHTATNILETICRNSNGSAVPHKHDALFDALVEALMIRLVLASI